MFVRLFLLFTLVPLLELFLLARLGSAVGFLPTMALVLFTGALGAWLARQQGMRTLARLRADMAAGRMPAEALVEGVLILLAGAVLLTPGLLTDVFGFALLTPPLRRLVQRLVRARLSQRVSGGATIIRGGTVHGRTAGRGPGRGGSGHGGPVQGSRTATSPPRTTDDEQPRVIVIEPDPPSSSS